MRRQCPCGAVGAADVASDVPKGWLLRGTFLVELSLGGRGWRSYPRQAGVGFFVLLGGLAGCLLSAGSWLAVGWLLAGCGVLFAACEAAVDLFACFFVLGLL